jgi:hypothetical protein
MTKVTFPNKSDSYEVDGVSIMVFPDKIIVDTGSGRRNNDRDDRRDNRNNNYRRDDDRGSRRNDDRKKEPEKKKNYDEQDPLNRMLDNAEALITGKKKW